MKKGYHYTSKKNWDKIQRDGRMTPYFFDPKKEGKEELARYFPRGVNGIWLWRENPQGKSHAGNILFQVSTKGEEEIVKLEVDYHPATVLDYKGMMLDIHHHGHVGEWIYHTDDRSVLITEAIPVSRIRVIGQYNTVQRFQ